ncbi:MAG TPA: tetraacyldisaccharide 4'-kinase, partial [Flavitalea sp.]|nr:tetraacyldisaccharide 4'-kinase [Flavitalea sp.]
RRAQLLVITKCPAEMSAEEAEKIREEIDPAEGQELFFTSILYGTPYHILAGNTNPIDEETEVLLVTGIANPRPLKNYLSNNTESYYEMLYDDHHIFSIDDWKEIINRFKMMQSEKKMILTTEKDAVRLIKFEQELKELPFYVIPMKMEFLFGSERKFIDLIITFIKGFKTRKQNN